MPTAISATREAAEAMASLAGPSDQDAAGSDSDVPVVEGGEGGEAIGGDARLPPEKVKLEHSVSDIVEGGSDALEITVQVCMRCRLCWPCCCCCRCCVLVARIAVIFNDLDRGYLV